VIRKVWREGTNWIARTIAGVSGTTGATDGTNNQALFNGPYHPAVDKAGCVLVGEVFNGTIRKLTPNGTNWVVTTFGGKAGEKGCVDGPLDIARFANPIGITLDDVGTIYVSDAGGVIRRISLAGTNWIVSTIGGRFEVAGASDGVGTNALFQPVNITLDSSGSVFIADNGNQTIRRGELRMLLALKFAESQPLLSWPREASNYFLEMSSTFDGTSWSRVSNGIVSSAAGFVYTNGLSVPGSAYFRLHAN
jgi:hypothetical protein